ncbi:MAG: hypothetical protein MR970_01960 [Spirochaetia bacterium]|nr:hypothetical protein [Spirochaetia bacterium]
MAVTKIVKELDSKLMEDGTISKEFEADYQKVHKMLNTFVKQTGGQVTAENFKKGEDTLRDWLMILYKQGATQERLTSYLRCGFAHLSYDFISTQEENAGLASGELITRALQSFKKRKFNTKYFKLVKSKAATKISLKDNGTKAIQKPKETPKPKAASKAKPASASKAKTPTKPKAASETKAKPAAKTAVKSKAASQAAPKVKSSAKPASKTKKK